MIGRKFIRTTALGTKDLFSSPRNSRPPSNPGCHQNVTFIPLFRRDAAGPLVRWQCCPARQRPAVSCQ